MNLKFLFVPVMVLLAGIQAVAQTQTIAFYQLGKSSAVTYVAGPDILTGATSREPVLTKSGNPLFFASAPELPGNKVKGSLLFREPADQYAATQAIGSASDDFVLETWANPSLADDKDFHIVVANGNAANGYAIAQQGAKWVAIGDGQAVPLAMKMNVEWTHLAIVAIGREVKLYLNGKLVNRASRSDKLDSSFTIGNSKDGKQPFHGMIYSVRYSLIHNGKFDEQKDFLLNYNEQKIVREKENKERQDLIKNISREGFGIKIVSEFPEEEKPEDWLIKPAKTNAAMLVKVDNKTHTARLRLSNGLVRRDFYVGENLACYSFKNISNDAEYLRAVKPEVRIRLDTSWFDIGGLSGQPEKSYLIESWLDNMLGDPGAFRFTGITSEPPKARYPWQQRYNAVHTDWPPKGLHIIMHYAAPEIVAEAYKNTKVQVHYEIYDGIPVIAKWVTLQNGNTAPVTVDQIETEVLAVAQDQVTRLHTESDFSFAFANADPQGSALIHYARELKPYHAGKSTTSWRVDEAYNTWASHNQAEDNFLHFPHHNLLVSSLPMGPFQLVEKDSSFQSYVTFELLHDSDDKERQALAHRKFYRKLAPQVSESLLAGAITSQDPAQIKGFIDQMGELGFERLDIHPWPGISHDNLDQDYVSKWGDIAGYAKKKGIVMGGYELNIASRGRGAEVDVIDPVTLKPGSIFGQSVCIASKWADDYFGKLGQFYNKTGFLTYNMDGPYHGDPCASTIHAHHRELKDSQWAQWKRQVSVIHGLLGKNIYVPIPDWYFLNGQSATGMGYREASANLTPEQQMLLGRQYIYDGTFHKAPTMGWMTVQLTGFYSNDPKIGLEPLKDNISRYERTLFQHLASGCQLTVRGNRLYDTPETKQMVQKWTEWFKKYRGILTSDIIHLGRPTGRDLDCMLHVNPELSNKGMAIIFNPTGQTIKKKFRLPLYYTGLSGTARIREQEGEGKTYDLNRDSEAAVDVEIAAGGFTWLVIE
ncbi:LamG domain-containing protein [Dyadobacter bucti]|uniref:LamG domain-containing protein n=1 Tax=Dyadobacter bucti TaxID=2572203 RepID=UPI003F708274